MKKPKNENKMLIIISIIVFVLIIILTILFQVILPSIEEEKPIQTDEFVADKTTTMDNIHKPSENEWITLQLSRRRI